MVVSVIMLREMNMPVGIWNNRSIIYLSLLKAEPDA